MQNLIISTSGKAVYDFFSEFVDTESKNTLVVSTDNEFNVLSNFNEINSIINLSKINDIRYINKYIGI